MQMCRKCGSGMDEVLLISGMTEHPNCEPVNDLEVAGQLLLSDITDIIRWTDRSSERSQQRGIGPSELGGDCDRKIAYRLAGVEETNHWMDPLAAIVGTSIHTWMQEAVAKFQRVHYMDRWETELTVQCDPLVVGHTDLYDRELQICCDYKTVSPTKLKEWKSKGPPQAHRDQVNLYAKGLIASGRPVKYVVLIAIPRAGTSLRDIKIWIEEYDPARAQKCLDRMYAIANTLIKQGDDLDFEAIPATPSDSCSYCPWYRGGTGAADVRGCTGNVSDAQASFAKGLVA